MPSAKLTKNAKPQNEAWVLRLYVAGQTPKSVSAFANLKRICSEHLSDKYRIELIDLLENPQLARGDQIVAIPTLVRNLPTSMKKNHRRSIEHRSGLGRVRPATRADERLIYASSQSQK